VEAMKKLSEGRGNLVTSAQKLKDLGAKSSKQISVNLLERAEEKA
jgi:DNA recombination protein RmuC